jgi:hypothetical protein
MVPSPANRVLLDQVMSVMMVPLSLMLVILNPDDVPSHQRLFGLVASLNRMLPPP